MFGFESMEAKEYERTGYVKKDGKVYKTQAMVEGKTKDAGRIIFLADGVSYEKGLNQTDWTLIYPTNRVEGNVIITEKKVCFRIFCMEFFETKGKTEEEFLDNLQSLMRRKKNRELSF